MPAKIKSVIDMLEIYKAQRAEIVQTLIARGEPDDIPDDIKEIFEETIALGTLLIVECLVAICRGEKGNLIDNLDLVTKNICTVALEECKTNIARMNAEAEKQATHPVVH